MNTTLQTNIENLDNSNFEYQGNGNMDESRHNISGFGDGLGSGGDMIRKGKTGSFGMGQPQSRNQNPPK